MATNPDALLPQTPPENLLALREEGVRKVTAALKTRKATLKQIKDIAKEHAIEITNEDALREQIAYSRIPGSNLDLLKFNIDLSMYGAGAEGPQVSAAPRTLQSEAFGQTVRLAEALGLPRGSAQSMAESLVGSPGGDLSLMDFTPLAAPTDIQLGSQEFMRGLRFREPGTASLGALQTLLGLAEVVPVVGAASRLARTPLSRARQALAGRASPAQDVSREVIERLDPSQVPPTPMQQIVRQPELPPTRLPSRPSAPTPRPEAPDFSVSYQTPGRVDAQGLPVIPRTPQRQAAAEEVLAQGSRVPAPQDFGLVDRAGNINLSKLPPDANLRETVRVVADSNNLFLDARRNVMSMDELADLADGVALESVLKRELGEAFNAEEIIAARRMLRAAADDSVAAAARYTANPQDANLREQAVDALVRQIAIQEQLAGAAAEAGRALRALRELDDPGRRADINAIVRTLRVDGKSVDPDKIDEVLENLAAIGDNPDAAARFVSDLREPDFFDKILEYRVSSLLAGPQTQAKNVLSNALMTITRPFEEAAAAGFGKLTRSQDAPTFREVGYRALGLGQGTIDGFRAIRSVYRGEDLGDVGSKIELPRRRAIRGTTGRLVRIPLTALEMGDEFFKAVNRRSQLSASAYRRARNEAGGDAARQAELYAEYLENPTKEMKKEAQDFALYQTFQTPLGQQDRFLSNLGRRLQSAAQDSDLRVIQFAAPFIRTPVNLAQAALDRLGLSRTVWRDVFKPATPGAREVALGKLTMGYGTVFGIQSLHEKGYITGGGPTDYAERLALMQTGWQPYSFKIGDTYYSYEGIEPFATIIGLTADAADLARGGDFDILDADTYPDAVASLAGAVASNLTDKTFTRGISEIVEMWQRPEIYGQNFLQNFIASFVPNITAQTTRAIDPTLRQTDSVSQAVQSRIPGLAEDLPERLDAWGEPLMRTGYSVPSDQETGLGQGLAVAYNLISPIRVSESNKSDPVRSEVARLGMALPRLDREIRRTVPVTDRETGQRLREQVTMTMTQDTLNTLTRISGQRAHQAVLNIIRTPNYQNLNEDQKKEVIRRVLNESRQIERTKVFGIWAQNQFDGFSQRTPE